MLLLVLCAAGLAVAVAVRRRMEGPAGRKVVCIALAVGVALFIMQRLVVTDRETLEQTVRGMAQAVDRGDVSALGEYLDAEFHWADEDRPQFLKSANRTLTDYQVDEARVFGMQCEVRGDRAVVRFRALCDVRHGDEVQYGFPTRWELQFARRDGRWLLERIDLARWELPGGGSFDLRSEVR